MARHQHYINLAIKVSQLSNHKFRIGVILIKGNRVISIGINRYKTHPEQINPHTGKQGSSIHAELDAIIRAPYTLLQNSSIYVARILKNNNTGYCRPCKSCIALLKNYGISKIFYTTENMNFRSEVISTRK